MLLFEGLLYAHEVFSKQPDEHIAVNFVQFKDRCWLIDLVGFLMGDDLHKPEHALVSEPLLMQRVENIK